MFNDTIISNRWVPLFKPAFYEIMKKGKPFSMVSRKRMQNIWRLLQRIERDKLNGDFVELGVAHGGTAIILALFAEQFNQARETWLYDGFEEVGDPDITYAKTYNNLYEIAKLNPEHVHLIKGLFQDTLPKQAERQVCFVHIDASGYIGVKAGLELIYPQVVEGGWVVFDNFGVDEGCRDAIRDVFIEKGLSHEIQRFERTQAYFQKI